MPNVLTVDSDRANFPLHNGVKDFLVQVPIYETKDSTPSLKNRKAYYGEMYVDLLIFSLRVFEELLRIQ